MNLRLIPVAIVLLALVSGCTLPNPTITPEKVIRTELEIAEDYLANPKMSPALFQFATINEESGVVSGFIIDKYGQIRSYELAETPSEFVQYRSTNLDRSLIQRLLDASTDTGVSVDLQDLARRVQIYHRQTIQDVDQRSGNSASEETIAFYAYAVASENSGTGSGCGDDNDHSQNNENTVLQLPLYVQGKVNLTNQSAYVEEMVQWLTELIPDQTSK